MSASETQPQFSVGDVLELMEQIEMAQSLDGFAERALPLIARMMQSSPAFLYISDTGLYAPRFFQYGFNPEVVSKLKSLCALQLDAVKEKAVFQPFKAQASPPGITAVYIMLYPLENEEDVIGLLGLEICKNEISPVFSEKLSRLLAARIRRFTERIRSERQLSYLNQYLTVSSMLAQSIDLHELLEITLNCCMEAVSAEASSVLLLDENKENFFFYNVEGPAKSLLMAATFPADKGIAGSVMQTQQPEIINDVSNDPRFYGKIDTDSGFQTRNIIAIPLTAGEEKIGVLEVLNKTDGASFSKDERHLLQMIAEEIAFAIRNAKLFEYVVNTYCKQRQGQLSCRGCKRPLGSWTPCVKYRDDQ